MGRCPLIEVQGLTKLYEGRPAIVDLTFSVPRGQVLGLLGPAGAGKTTLLRILTGGVSATAGTARVAGGDALAQSREARRRVGYLAQATPLYDDMRVTAYLETMCRLRGVPPPARRSRVDGTLELCGLADRRGEIIGHLPMDGRQRLGLAQALVHDPEVLILDEPVAGLDEAQATAARRLVGDLGRSRTVVLASHRLSDVGATCGRILILERGRLVADDTPADLARRFGQRRGLEVVALVRGDPAEVERHLLRIDGAAEVALTDLADGRHRVTVTGDREDLQDAVARTIVQGGFRLEELSSRETTAPGVPRDLAMEDAS
jgi:ABC-2 type transport system ATP-binding protein